MIIFGTGGSNIGQRPVLGSKCQNCGTDNAQIMAFFGRYFHIFWIPFFPIGRKVVTECQHCKQVLERNQFSPQLNEAYARIRPAMKTPIWHFLLLLIGGGLMGFGLISASIGLMTAKSQPHDPRADSLYADVAWMQSHRVADSDTVAQHLKAVFEFTLNEELELYNFSYRTRVKDGKVLCLIKIPALKKLEKDLRWEIVEMAEAVLDEEYGLTAMPRYIGIHGNYNMMMVKTPTVEESSRLALQRPLYEFYGPPPAAPAEPES